MRFHMKKFQSLWRLKDGDRQRLARAKPRPISRQGDPAMFKIAVVVFALAVSGFMLWIAHEDANFAQLPHATFLKRAA
jgi:hypothetical protein